MRTYAVNYEGWLIIEASNETEAEAKANEMLSEAGLINDGQEGEWMLADVIEEDEE